MLVGARAGLRCMFASVKSWFGSALLVLLVVAGVLLVACPGPTFVVQQYNGPARTNASIAILRVNGNDPARLLILDDEEVAVPIERDSRLHIEMLPGPHSLVVVNASSNERSPVIAFKADAGKVYRAAFAPDGVAHVFEVNRSNDALGPDATTPVAIEPAAPPRWSTRRDTSRTASSPSVAEDAGATDAGE